MDLKEYRDKRCAELNKRVAALEAKVKTILELVQNQQPAKKEPGWCGYECGNYGIGLETGRHELAQEVLAIIESKDTCLDCHEPYPGACPEHS